MDPTAISLCSGAFGLDLGLLEFRGDLCMGLDISKNSEAVAKSNLPDMPFIRADISEVETEDILDEAGLRTGEATFIVGGPPCQPFTILGREGGFDDPRSSPIREFFRVIREAEPQFFIMEEVTGIMRNPDDWNTLLNEALTTGYKLRIQIVQAADYGVPQKRRRLIIFGSKNGRPPRFPIPTHAGDPSQQRFTGEARLPWVTLRDAIGDLQGTEMSWCPLPPEAREALPLILEGGNWKNLPPEMAERLMGSAFKSNGGKTGFFRRLAWNRPSPTILTRPIHKMTFCGHPDEMRPLSVEESKRIQTFPDNWEMPVSQSGQYELIGNAVPPLLATHLFSVFPCWNH